MISVIVPVYNVEPYLRKCLDSVIGQTYKDLEILVVDDGSTDQSGAVCDEYTKDVRVKVFHTENRGLSCARNLGLDEAHGDWICFVDSDDWIEPGMFGALLEKAEESGADVAMCGYYREYPNQTITFSPEERLFERDEALGCLLRGVISVMVWNKIYRRTLFRDVRFPDGRSFEDIATTHRVIKDSKVIRITEPYYHWAQRESGISQNHDIQNLIDYWTSYKQRYDELKEEADGESKAILLKGCASAIARVWMWYLKSEKSPEFVRELSAFAKCNFPRFGFNGWPASLRFSIFLARYNHAVSFATAYAINRMYRFFKPKYYK